MKGLELPVSTVVVVAVGVLVLVVVSAFFLSQSTNQFGEIDRTQEFHKMCAGMQCSASQAQSIGEDSAFYKACKSLYGPIKPYECLRACGCSDSLLSQGVSSEDTEGQIAALQRQLEQETA